MPYSYGFAIISLTLMVKLATFPLTQKQASTLIAGRGGGRQWWGVRAGSDGGLLRAPTTSAEGGITPHPSRSGWQHSASRPHSE